MEKKEFNPNFGSGFTDDRFGQGAVVVTVTAENLKTLTENLQIGSKLILKPNKETKYGNMHYHTEIMPPYDGIGKTAAKTKTVTAEVDELG